MFGAPSRYGAPAGRYRDVDVQARIEGASPHGLVAILFDELLKGLDTLRAAERTGTTMRHGGVQSQVVSIIQGLEAGLDRQRGGDIARNLGRVYRQSSRLIATYGPERAATLDEARTMLGEIAGAWSSIG
ncbi:flagellar export chaperone FliS [Sphingomonas nostoxanthinifaciens]|uniref:flagellar export chaperone FliS n=1 Tax=Sphingomonas nostoxanthinifaciens TaxID=2872652 RepID=UPI001CC1F9AA|nr:flagellar export chaperone FliS [Sphingomonas nostoxanthinifaciens]UAK22977.1 flagellar protein FliS [Sphingomonas nostoxanthinifaciens]